MQRSEIWKFYTKRSEREATCKICFKTIKTCGNTSNMCKHMKQHPECSKKDLSKNGNESKLQFERIDKPSSSSKISAVVDEDCEMVSVETSPSIIKNRQLSITETVRRRSSYNEGGFQQTTIIKCLLYFICVDKRPFDVVKGRGFHRLMKQVCPHFKIPSVDLLKSRLDQFYEIKQNEVAKYFETQKNYCLTCDTWTETMTATGYLGITVHFLNGDQLRARCIATVELDERHTAEYISHVLEEKCLEFNIFKDNITCIVTDNGANMVAAVKKFVGLSKHLPCFAHTINLVVETVIKIEEVGMLCDKVRAVVKFIRNSVNQSDELRKKQRGTPLKLILDVRTRWNSVYYMLNRYSELAPIIHQMLCMCSRAPPLPTVSDLEEIKQLIIFLKPFEYVTTEMSGEQYVTASKVIPIANTLKKQMAKTPVNGQSSMMKLVKETILRELEKRFGDTENHPLLCTSTLLDPRFKEIPFNSKLSLDLAKSHIRSLNVNANASISSDTDSNVSDPDFAFDFWKNYKTLAHGNKKRISTSNEDELAAYLKGPVVSLKTDANMQWEDMKYIFPGLYKMSREYLLIPATSVPSERLFSKAGAIMTKTRNRLAGKRLDKLLFLGDCTEAEWDL